MKRLATGLKRTLTSNCRIQRSGLKPWETGGLIQNSPGKRLRHHLCCATGSFTANAPIPTFLPTHLSRIDRSQALGSETRMSSWNPIPRIVLPKSLLTPIMSFHVQQTAPGAPPSLGSRSRDQIHLHDRAHPRRRQTLPRILLQILRIPFSREGISNDVIPPQML